MRQFFTLFRLPFAITLALILAWQPSFASSMHGIAMHGDLKYPEGFTHFDYTNPSAPKGGTLKLGVVGDNFDSFNPFIIKGVAAAGTDYLYQTLLEGSDDEAFSEYGLIAERLTVPADRSSVTFHLNPNARFSDGSAITAEDVKFSFDTLTTHESVYPGYAAYYADVEKVEIISDKEIRFVFKHNKNKELPLILGQLKILSKAYWSTRDFGKTSLDFPVGNGPYVVEDVQPGRSVTLKRNPDYWAADLPVNKGKYNFDKIIFEYFKDNTIALEAFKAGEFDFRVERTARNWANAYNGPKFDSGELIKEEIAHNRPAGMQAFIYNTRRELFKDARVREALAYAFDYEWTNQNLFNSQYTRTDSFFENSELASSGLPKGEELAILKQFEKQLPAKVFTEAYQVPSTEKPNNIRTNLRKAVKLLREAGWKVKNSVLVNEEGQVFEFEFLIASKDFERVVLPFIKNLNKLGVKASIRLVDVAQYINRRRSFDYDVMVHVIPQSDSPGNEQRDFWHSANANKQGSQNLMGVSHPVIDELVEMIISAPSRKALVNRARALDRILLHSHYVIPNWHNPKDRVSYAKKLKRPKITPKKGTDIDTWWISAQ